jgi:ferritin-like metal-binding protein YciE
MASDQLTTWLNDAHAMERGLIPILQQHAQDARRDMPEAAARIEQHITETELHARRLEECLAAIGSTPSTVKSTLSSLMGSIESVATGMFRDEPVKNVLTDYGAEQFEVACYRALITAARQYGRNDVAELCEMNMQEDEAMALWLRDQIPAVVTKTLTRMGV